MTDLTHEHDRSLRDFELLLQRPLYYFSLSPRQQWIIDEEIGALDAFVEVHHLTPNMKQRWFDHFGVQL